MTNQGTISSEEPQPAAYDEQGRPLYHHPPAGAVPTAEQPPKTMVSSRPESYEGHNFDPRLRTQYANEPDLVHATRKYEPQVPVVSERLQKIHKESAERFPYLNLSEGEFVMLQIRRHPIGMLIPAVGTIVLLLVLSAVTLALPDIYPVAAESTGLPSVAIVIGLLALLMGIVTAFGGIAIWVYLRNQFFLTNESVIQEIQHSLFSRHEQTVSLGSIEDVSFRKQGVMQYIFNYGTMRLSTEGEETTYRFAFVEDPKKQTAAVSNAIEAFKNGRPVGEEFLEKQAD